MENLSNYKKNGLSNNYIAVFIDGRGMPEFETFKSKSAAECFCKQTCAPYEVYTFRQCVRRYPEHFSFE